MEEFISRLDIIMSPLARMGIFTLDSRPLYRISLKCLDPMGPFLNPPPPGEKNVCFILVLNLILYPPGSMKVTFPDPNNTQGDVKSCILPQGQ